MYGSKIGRAAAVFIASTVVAAGLITGSGVADAETIPPVGSTTNVLLEIANALFLASAEVIPPLSSSLGSVSVCPHGGGFCLGMG